jgi:hypothetical protein
VIDYYGDNNRWFIGKVMSIDDPQQLGRVQIRIFGIHGDEKTDIAQSDLPWAQVVVPVTEGQSSGIGATTGIKNQTQVYGIFLDGKDSQLPLVLGGIPKIESIKERRDKPLTLIGGSNTERAFNFFISAEGGEFTPQQACGIIGNLLAESGSGVETDINPLAQNAEEGSFGIAQWNPAEAAGYRLNVLKLFCDERGYNYQELYPQLEYIKYELHRYSYLGLAELREANTPREASIVFEKKYERPAEGSTQRRINYAEEIFEKMTSEPVGPR